MVNHLNKLIALSAIVVTANVCVAAAEVKEQLLSPAGQGVTFFASPAPADIATIGPSGSRVAVYRNGEPGPKFDEIINTGATPEGGAGMQLVFSPDGKRLAYAGRTRGEYVLMVDGEEVARGPYDGRQNTILGLGFSADSQHYFYRALEADEAGKQVGKFVMDGTASPDVHPSMQIVVSPLGGGYVMFARSLDTGEQMFFRDGVVRDESPNRVMYRHDGKLYTLEQDAQNQHIIFKREGELLFEGDATPVEFVLPDAGERWAILCSSGTGVSVNAIVDGKRYDEAIPNAITPGQQRFFFSPNGQRWAAIIEPARGRQFVLLDGEPQDEYQKIEALSFSPDSSKITYWGRSPTGAYFINDGEEMDGASTVTIPAVYGNDGANVAWTLTQSRTGERSVLVDGQKHIGTHQLQHTTIRFSPDGTRMAFMDGATIHEYTSEGFKAYEGIRVVASAADARGRSKLFSDGYLYSPDSKFIAFFGSDMAARKSGLFVNGSIVQEVPNGFGITRLAFSPDSRHIYYVVGTGNGRVLFVDGQQIMEYPYTQLEDDPDMWSVDDNGVLHFVSVDQEGIKRYSVTPSDETSIDDLLKGG